MVLPEFRTVPASVAILLLTSLLAKCEISNVVGFRTRYERKTFEFALGCCMSLCSNKKSPTRERFRDIAFYDRLVRRTFNLRLKTKDREKMTML